MRIRESQAWRARGCVAAETICIVHPTLPRAKSPWYSRVFAGHSKSCWTERRDDSGNVVRSYKHFSCVMAQVDGAWPEVSITREGIIEKALDLVGFGDIQLESDEFNRLFALRSPDHRFAVTLVDARMID